MARPKTYSLKAAEALCERIRSGCSMQQVYRISTMPGERTFYGWRREHPEFEAMYRTACEDRDRMLAKGGGKGTVAGRPTLYTPQIAHEICERLERGQSIWDMRRAGMPLGPVYFWLKRHPDFRRMYALARAVATHEAAVELVKLADDDEGDCIEEPDGRLTAHPTRLKRARLQLEARRWHAVRQLPKKYTLEAVLAEDAEELGQEDWLGRLG